MINLSTSSSSKQIVQCMAQLQAISTQAHLDYIDIIVDQAGLEQPLIPALIKREKTLHWFSFFTDKPEEELLEQAPIMIRFRWAEPTHLILLEEILTLIYASPRAIMLFSPLPFDVLSKVLQALSDVQWGEQSCLFRFYDPRIFPELMNTILTKKQCQQFHRLVYSWGWIDRDKQLRWLLGEYVINNLDEIDLTIVLSDKQFSLVGYISDVEELMEKQEFINPELNLEQNFIALYDLARQCEESQFIGHLSTFITENRTSV